MTELQRLLHDLLGAMYESEREIAMSRRTHELSEAEHHAAAITDLRNALERYRNVSIGELIDATVGTGPSRKPPKSVLRAYGKKASEQNVRKEGKTKATMA